MLVHGHTAGRWRRAVGVAGLALALGACSSSGPPSGQTAGDASTSGGAFAYPSGASTSVTTGGPGTGTGPSGTNGGASASARPPANQPPPGGSRSTSLPPPPATDTARYAAVANLCTTADLTALRAAFPALSSLTPDRTTQSHQVDLQCQMSLGPGLLSIAVLSVSVNTDVPPGTFTSDYGTARADSTQDATVRDVANLGQAAFSATGQGTTAVYTYDGNLLASLLVVVDHAPASVITSMTTTLRNTMVRLRRG